MGKNPKKSVSNEFEAWKEDHWENVRRNKEYKEKHEEYQNLFQRRTGKDRWPRTKLIALGLKIAERYGLVEPIDPSSPYSKDLSEKIQIISGFLIFPSRFCQPILHPIKESSFNVIDEESTPKNRAGAGARYAPGLRKGTRKECLFDEKFLGLLINPLLPFKQIRSQVEEAVRCAKERISDWKSGFIEERKRFETNKEARHVYDLRQQGKTFSEIQKILYPKEDSDSSLTKVKRLHKKAKNLI